jgi:hypothetical protein
MSVQAGVRKDVDAIAAVTAYDYVMIDFEGKVRNKAATLERIKSNEIQLQSNSLDEVDVRIYGTTAIVTGRATPKGAIGGKTPSAIRDNTHNERRMNRAAAEPCLRNLGKAKWGGGVIHNPASCFRLS